MSYEIINSIPQFNFQINRILTYGNLAYLEHGEKTENHGK